MMRSLTRVFLGLAIAASSFSFAGVGRIGNSSIGSETEGFETILPEEFPITNEAFHKIFMRTPFNTSNSQKTEIVGQTLANVFGDTRSISREEWFVLFDGQSSRQEWIEVPSHPCVLATRFINPSKEVIGVAAFGAGRGVVFTGSSHNVSYHAIKKMLQDIQLTDGDCQW